MRDDGSAEENQFSDLPFWLCRNWHFWSLQERFGMSFWVEPKGPRGLME